MEDQDSNNNSGFRIRTSNRRHNDFTSDDNHHHHRRLHNSNNNDGDNDDNNNNKWSGPFCFIQAADCQYGMIENFILKRPNPGWDEEIKLSEQAIDAINQMTPRPKFLVICGDLVDAMPGTIKKPKQVADFKKVFSKLDASIPLVCVCGNHDVGDEPTELTVKQYRETFGDDYFHFVTNGVLFIVINSQYYQHRKEVPQIAHEQDEWIEQMISKAKDYKYTFIFEHIPWFLEKPDEEDDYFNISKETRLKWLRKFKEAGVSKIMCGHYHRNAGGWYYDLEVVVTSAIGAQLGKDQSGLRVVRVLEKTIEHQYYAMSEIPKNVEL